MDDLVKSVKAQLYDRLSSPLLFTFALSWMAWNFRIILILLSSLSPSDKFLALDLLGLAWESEARYWVCHLVLFPLLTSALYIFALPWIERYVFEFSLARKRDLKHVRQRIEDEMPISTEEARELRSLADSAYREYDAVLRLRQEEIARLKLELSDLRSEMQRRPAAAVNEISVETLLSESQEDLLRSILKLGSEEVSKYAVFTESPEARIKVQYDIDELVRRQLITEFVAEDEHSREQYDAVSITSEGRRYLVEKLSADLV